MKYPRLARSAPSSLQDWLEEELENRGIDGVVYTRYILSLLQDDDAEDYASPELRTSSNSYEGSNSTSVRCCLHAQQKSAVKKQQQQCSVNKRIHKRYQNSVNSWDKNNHAFNVLDACDCGGIMNIEQKRSAVVECLKSASEKEFGIESLVDELCAKLNDRKFKMVQDQNESQKNEHNISTDSSDSEVSSPKEQAKRYYAAFPALSNLIETSKSIGKLTTDLKPRRASLETLEADGLNSESRLKWDGRKIIEVTKQDVNIQNSEGEASPRHSPNYSIQNLNLSSLGDEAIVELNNQSNIGLFGKNISKLYDRDSKANTENLCEIFENFEAKHKGKSYSCLEDNLKSANDWEEDKMKKLASKFNENISCLWGDDNAALSHNKSSIWRYDSSQSSPQSSTSPSPKFNAEKILDIDESSFSFRSSGDFQTKYYEHFGKNNYMEINAPMSSERELFGLDNWFSFRLKSKVNFVNNTSLRNHVDDSLFVKVISRKKYLTNEEKCADNMLIAPLSRFINTPLDAENNEEENLLTSPKTHFQPIKQDSFDNESEDGSSFEADAEVARLFGHVKEPAKSEPYSSKIQTHSDENGPVSSSSQNYSQEMSLLGSFINSQIEIKGSSLSDTSKEVENINFSDLFDESSSKTKSSTSIGPNSDKSFESTNSDLNAIDCAETEYQDLCTMLNEVLREDDGEKVENIRNNDISAATVWDWFEEDKEVVPSHKKEHRLSWSCYWDTYKPESPQNTEKGEHLEALQKEIKQEEDEIFADIKLLGEELNIDMRDIKNENMLNKATFNCKAIEETLGNDSSSNWASEQFIGFNFEDSDDPVSGWSNGGEYDPNIGASNECVDSCQVHYSWDLEEEWQKEESDTNPSNLQAKSKMDFLVDDSNWRRPCSFFLEGNCRRSDCKFSHDLGAITCKFWEEGSCFKGELCPFLHGYPLIDENGIKYDRRDPQKFMIDDESDFPALEVREESAPLSSIHTAEKEEKKVPKGGSKDKQHSQVLFRMVKKKRRKGAQQSYEKEV